MYQYKYKIQKEDLNYGGHVGNERSLLFFQWAREAMFESLGLSEGNLGDGAGVIQKNAYVEYDKQLFDGDDIVVKIVKFEAQKITFDLAYEIYRVSCNGGDTTEEKAVTGTTRLVCFDYTAKKIKKVPQIFIDKMNELFA